MSISEVIGRPYFKVVQNISNLKKFGFTQEPSNTPSGISSGNREISKMTNIIDLESTGLRISDRFANKPKQKYGLFDKLSLVVIGAREVAKNPHIFLTRAIQDIQEINRYFDGTLDPFGPMVFVGNQEKNEYYPFKDTLLQPYKSGFISSMIRAP